ncbi:MAG TPA: hypothetical protein VGM60_02845 [Pseudonocardia sp.]|jgi:hypothetical protein|uniref:hypothetical protein n=1 Tax=Pseudonocardia sp. TaxID=60912 RepID=UPI002F4250E8
MTVDTVLTSASGIVCTHTRPAGTPPPPVPVVPAVGGGRVTVTGAEALTVGGLTVLPFLPVPAPIAGCTAPNPPGNPCVGVATLVGGGARRLTVNGAPVLLAATFAATTNGLPPPAFDVTAGQHTLRAE